MKSVYGYITTVATFIAGFLIILWLTGKNPEISSSLGLYIPLLVILSGFGGGFVAPYHIKSNTFRSVGTIMVLGIGFLVILYLMLQQGSTSNDPFAGLGLIIIVFALAIATIIIMIAGSILVTIGGLIGSIFGRMVFPRDAFEEFQEYDYYENEQAVYS